MVPERKLDGNFLNDRKIHGERNVWSTAQRYKKIKGLDVDERMVMCQEAPYILRLKLRGRNGG